MFVSALTLAGLCRRDRVRNAGRFRRSPAFPAGRKNDGRGPRYIGSLALMLAFSFISTAVGQQVAPQDFSVNDWATAYALLLAPEAKPNWQIDGNPDYTSQLSVLPAGNVEPNFARVWVRLASTAQPLASEIVGRADKYALGPVGSGRTLRFPVYIVAPSMFGGKCKIAISSVVQKKQIAAAAKLDLRCDGGDSAEYSPQAAPIKGANSRWIRDPFGEDGYALLLVTRAVRTEFSGHIFPTFRVCLGAALADSKRDCDNVDLKAVLSSPAPKAQALRLSAKPPLSDSVFEDFRLPFVDKKSDTRVALSAQLLPSTTIDKGIAVALTVPASVGDGTEIATGRVVTPSLAEKKRRTFAVQLTNAGDVCPKGMCPIKLNNNQLPHDQLGHSRDIADGAQANVQVSVIDDWVVRDARLQHVGGGKRPVLDAALGSDQITLTKQQLESIDDYILELTLEKKKKTLRWQLEFDPKPSSSHASSSEKVSVTTDKTHELPVSQIQRLAPAGYTEFTVKSADSKVPTESGRLASYSHIKLPYPRFGQDEADYSVVLTPARVNESFLRSLKFSVVLNFGAFEKPLPDCRGTLVANTENMFPLSKDPVARALVTAPTAKIKQPLYVTDELKFEPDAGCRLPSNVSVNPVGRFDPQQPPSKISIQTRSQLMAAYVAATAGNDKQYLNRWDAYLKFIQNAYGSGYGPQSWMHGLLYSQTEKEDLTVPHEPALLSNKLIESSINKSLVDQAYLTRRAPRPFKQIASQIAAQLAPKIGSVPQTRWSLVYIDESVSFDATCDTYYEIIMELQASRGLDRAVVIVPTTEELLGAGPDSNIKYVDRPDAEFRRCNLDQGGQFRVYSFAKKRLIDGKDYGILDAVHKDLRDWYLSP